MTTPTTPSVSIGVSLLLHNQRLDEAVSAAKEAERLGLDMVALPDSGAVMRDTYVAAAAIATATSRLRLGPLVTNLVTRHPLATAAACLSLDELTGGRAFIGVGTGQSAVYTIDEEPTPLAEFEAGVKAISNLIHSGRHDGWSIEWSGGSEMPVVVAAAGPRSLAVAGRVADAVVIDVGVDLEVVERCIAAAAESAGGRPLEVYSLVRGFVSEDADHGVSQIEGIIPSTASRLVANPEWKGVPKEVVDRLREFNGKYQYGSHGMGTKDWRSMAEQMGVWEYLLGRFGLVGSPRRVSEWLDDFQRLGGTGAIFSGAVKDISSLMDGLSRVKALQTGSA